MTQEEAAQDGVEGDGPLVHELANGGVPAGAGVGAGAGAVRFDEHGQQLQTDEFRVNMRTSMEVAPNASMCVPLPVVQRSHGCGLD